MSPGPSGSTPDKERPSPGGHPWSDGRTRGAAGWSAGVGDQALSSAGFAMLGMVSGCRRPPGTLRVAPGGLRERLTVRHWRVDRPLDGGLARQPALCINPETGRHRTGASVAQSSGPARPRSIRHAGRQQGSQVAARLSSGLPAPLRDRAKPGGTLLSPHPQTILPLPLRSHRRGCPPARGPSLPRRPCRNPCRHRGEPHGGRAQPGQA